MAGAHDSGVFLHGRWFAIAGKLVMSRLRSSRRQTAPRVLRTRPVLETLEDRLAPAAASADREHSRRTRFLRCSAKTCPSPSALDNTSPTDVGFGPYEDLYLPTTGADGAGAAVDDGITFVSASYLGLPVQATTVPLTAAGVPHPFAKDSSGNPLIITPPSGFRAGDTLVVLLLPFGSFTADQPPVDVSVTASLSNLADVERPADSIQEAQGGFRFGNDSLDNPTTDPTILGAPVTSTVTPAVFRLTKTYFGPEDETATGPNFPQQYRISVDVAAGQTITNLDITDVLPNDLQFVSRRLDLLAGRRRRTSSTPPCARPRRAAR